MVNENKQGNCFSTSYDAKRNCEKSVKYCDYSYLKQVRKMVDQSINCTTEGVKYYDSLYSVQIHHPINSGIMKIDCVKKFVKQVLQRKTIVSINSSKFKKTI